MRAALIIILLAPLLVCAQSKKDVKAADKLFKQEQYAEALPLFKNFINMAPANVDFVYKYGACVLMETNHTDEALKLLLKAEEMGKKDQEVAYFIGRAYEKNEKYEEAMAYYERFKLAATKEDVKNLKIKKRIKSCKKALK